MSKLSFRLSRVLASGRDGKGLPATREDVLATLLKKRAAAHKAGLSDLERQLREQIRSALPIQRPDGGPFANESPPPPLPEAYTASSPAGGARPAPAKAPRPPRHQVEWPGELFAGETGIPVRLRNISAEGGMLSGYAGLRTGQEVVLTLQSAGAIFATVRWAASGSIGLKFDKRFDVEKVLRLAAGRASGPEAGRFGILKPQYLQSETEADSPWAARWDKLRPEDL